MAHATIANHAWLFTTKWAPPLSKAIPLLDKYERWRRVAHILKVSKAATVRLEWIIYYHEGPTATETARHFGIARKTFHKWFALFDEDNLYSVRRLQDQSRAPKHVRVRQIIPLQQQRIIALRRAHMHYGKQKLAVLYLRNYGEKISSWKIQKVIEVWKLYPNPRKASRVAAKRRRARAHHKKRITELELNGLPWYKKKAGYIICLDTVVIYWNQYKRFIFTAIDKYGKVAFARMYTSKSTLNARDFLSRLYYLLNGQVPRVGHDNGTEFEKYFKQECERLGIAQYYSRVRTPKDNPENERFNRTLQEEFINDGNFHPDPAVFNPKLTEWLVEYNFMRPHASLNYQTPIAFTKVLPMYSSCTRA